MGRNPKTGDAIAVPPKRVPFFTVGHELRKRINEDFQPTKAAPVTEIEVPAIAAVPEATAPEATAPETAPEAIPAVETISESTPTIS